MYKWMILNFSEVCKALNKTRGLYQRWCELQEETVVVLATREEADWTNTELRNALRSIEWDLEDLEETIDILLLLSTIYYNKLMLHFRFIE